MIRYRIIDKLAGDEEFEAIEKLFLQLYDYMYTCGLNLKLADGGEKMWLKSIKSTLSRINHLVVALDDDSIIGFAQGMIRLTPEYLGGKKAGFISFVYTEPTYRKTGTGEQMVILLEDCFKNQNVDYIELEVLVENESAISFWNKLGYKNDLIRMKKTDIQ